MPGRELLITRPTSASHARVPSHHRAEQLLMPWVARGIGADVFHSPDFIPPLRYRGRSVITIHDLAFLIYPHFMTRDAARYYGSIDRAVRHADQIIAVSQSTKRDLIRMLGTPEEKISVIYEAADPLMGPVDRTEALQRVKALYDLPEDFILFVSTIEPRKNVGGLLHAYSRLRQDYKLTPALVLVGAPGWLSDDVYALVDKLEIRPYTFFLGRVEASNLRYLYNAARCLVHPAFYEGFGLTPLEAMACGTPVIVSNISSLPEVVGGTRSARGPAAGPGDHRGLVAAADRQCAGRRTAAQGPAARQRLLLAARGRTHDGCVPEGGLPVTQSRYRQAPEPFQSRWFR